MSDQIIITLENKDIILGALRYTWAMTYDDMVIVDDEGDHPEFYGQSNQNLGIAINDLLLEIELNGLDVLDLS